MTLAIFIRTFKFPYEYVHPASNLTSRLYIDCQYQRTFTHFLVKFELLESSSSHTNMNSKNMIFTI